MTDIQIRKDNGEVIEYSKEEMTEDQKRLFEDLKSLQQRCIEIEPLAREFSDKKQLVDLKSKLLLDSLQGEENAQEKASTKTID